MQTRDLRFEIKSVDNAGVGTFTGRASVAGNVDSYNDVVMPGAFAADLAANGTRRPLLWQHNPGDPVGYVDLQEQASGDLLAKGTLLLDVPQAKTAYALLKGGALNGLSIGYDSVRETYAGSIRQLEEIKLWEISLVTFPANSFARVTNVKHRDRDDMRQLVADVNALSLKISLARLTHTIRDCAFRARVL